VVPTRRTFSACFRQHRINATYADETGRPYVDIRILHTHVLVDPFPDPPGLAPLVPPASPTRLRPEEERLPLRLSAEEAAGVEGAWESQCGGGGGGWCALRPLALCRAAQEAWALRMKQR
jgi:hypothetical protein